MNSKYVGALLLLEGMCSGACRDTVQEVHHTALALVRETDEDLPSTLIFIPPRKGLQHQPYNYSTRKGI